MTSPPKAHHHHHSTNGHGSHGHSGKGDGGDDAGHHELGDEGHHAQGGEPRASGHVHASNEGGGSDSDAAEGSGGGMVLSGGDSVILYAMTGRANTAAAADLATTRGGGGSGGHDMGMAALGESVLWSNACIEVEDKKLGTKYVCPRHCTHCTLIALSLHSLNLLLQMLFTVQHCRHAGSCLARLWQQRYTATGQRRGSPTPPLLLRVGVGAARKPNPPTWRPPSLW